MSNTPPAAKLSGLPIRFKLLFLLIALPLITLGAYIYIAIQLFNSDKIAYVFDSQASLSRTLSSQVNAEIQTYLAELRPLLLDYSPTTGQFSPRVQDAIRAQERIVDVTLYQKKPGEAVFTPYATLTSGTSAPKMPEMAELTPLFDKAVRESIALESTTEPETHEANVVLFANAGEDSATQTKLITLARFRSPDLLKAFANDARKQAYFVALLDHDERIILGQSAQFTEASLQNWPFYRNAKAQGFLESVQETMLPDQRTSVLAAITPVGAGNIFVLSYVLKEKALEASRQLIQKSFLFLIAILSLGILISFAASKAVTRSLSRLYQATQKIGYGDFSVKVDVESSDEVGVLAQGFNHMASEVSRLMLENTDRVRMEKELETARTVQETLFPALAFDSERLRMRAFYQPASECCGDWWHYTKSDGAYYFWVGDATGHGVAAALITSAACSAASLIEQNRGFRVCDAMWGLDLAIRATSKGQMLMSFFCAKLDETTGVLTYTNAAHNFPFWVKRTGEAPTRKDILRLNEAKHPHLGSADSGTFTQHDIQLSPGDMVVFYTDGLTELKNANDDMLGEKKVIQTILSAVQKNFAVETVIAELQEKVTEFKGDRALDDDLTLFIVQYQPPAASATRARSTAAQLTITSEADA